jgi:UDP-N-acetyl-D-glucosamine dehydrogenase
MPYWVVERIVAALGDRGRALAGAEILILGVAYKKDVDDLRESPALKLIEILEARGAKVSYHDPFVPTLRTRRLRRYDVLELDSVPIDAGSLGRFDCVVIATNHSAFDWDAIVASSRLVVDTRNATRGVTSHRERIVRA